MSLVAVALTLLGCADAPADIPWSGKVDAVVDDLTGLRTGLFRTYGPTQVLSGGQDTIPVTIGYWCRVDERSQPHGHRDGLFFQIAMPDTSLLSNDMEAFEELSGQLGLLDVARMAVDGQLYAWEYEPQPTYGGWFLDGRMGFAPPADLATQVDRDSQMYAIQDGSDAMVRYPYDEQLRELVRQAATGLREDWAPAHDFVASHYMGRDTVGIELKGVLTFSMEGFDAATDSVRFWCPVVESQQQWNTVRATYVAAVDSLVAEANDQVAARRDADRQRVQEDDTSTQVMRELTPTLYQFAVDWFVEFARDYGVHPIRTREDACDACSRFNASESARTRFGSGGVFEVCRQVCDSGSF